MSRRERIYAILTPNRMTPATATTTVSPGPVAGNWFVAGAVDVCGSPEFGDVLVVGVVAGVALA